MRYYIVNGHFDNRKNHSNQGHAQSPALKFHPYMVAGAAGITNIHNRSCQMVSFKRKGKLLTKAPSSSVEIPGARKAALRKDMLAPAAMMQAGFTSLPHSGWKMKALDFFVSLEDDIPFL